MADTESPIETLDAPPKKRRKHRRWFIFALLVLGLVWLNGPGLRWLGPRVASHFLENAGLRGSFHIDGNLLAGLSVLDLRIEGDMQLARLSIDRLDLDYHWRGLIRGQLDGLTVDGIHADLRLGLEEASENEKTAPDLKTLVETLRSLRGRLVPVELDLKNISLAASRDGRRFFALAPSRISHQAGNDDILLELGAFTDATGRDWPARNSAIIWSIDKLSVERIEASPGVSIRKLVVPLPAGGKPSLEAELHVDEAVLVVTSAPGFASARIDLREGELVVSEIAKRFAAELPAAATVTSLAVELEEILPEPKLASGAVRLLLEDLTWNDWSAPEISLDATLTAGQADIAARGTVLGTAFSLDATSPVTRTGAAMTPGTFSGKFNLADVPSVLRGLATRFPAIDPEAPVPPSSLDGNFTVDLAGRKLQSATADLLLKPRDGELASPVSVRARWTPEQSVTVDLALDGLTANGTYQIDPATYEATVDLDEFANSRIDPWLSVARVKPGGSGSVSGRWTGGGEVKAGKHRGELALTQATWVRQSAPAITVIGGIKYDWPGAFETRGLRVKMNEQTVAVEAALAGGVLDLREFLWIDGATELASGTASLPAPADFSKWRDTLANDTRALAVSINSRVLSLALLKPWIPAFEKLDSRSTGRLDIAISGNFIAPVVEATLEARDLRSPAQPKLPPADLRVTLTGRDGRLVLDGNATAPDFAPAVIRASIPFRPADWAAAPGSFKDEPLDARMDLPRLDLSRFSSLVPAAERVAGIVTGNVTVSGVVGKPVLQGTLDLASAELALKGDRLPGIEGVTGKLDLALDRVVLRNLRGTSAGGNFQAEGSMGIAAGKPANLDLRFRGDHLLILRNDLLILRASADLRLLGPWENALLGGTVTAVDSIFYRDIELLPIGSPFTTPAAARVPKFDVARTPTAVALPEPFKNWGLNVQVRTQDPVLIRGNFATGEITGAVAISGTLGNPSPNGVVRIKDFRAALPFSTLSVPSGTATFTPATGFDPILEIRGTAEPRPYRVTLYAYGRSSDPQLILTSTPPLAENEIMTLLATGTTTQGLVNPQAASARAIQLLAEEIRRGRFRFGRQLRPLLALLDNVDFNLDESDPYSADSYSTATISLTDRWLLSAGVGATGDTRALVIWRLSFR